MEVNKSELLGLTVSACGLIIAAFTDQEIILQNIISDRLLVLVAPKNYDIDTEIKTEIHVDFVQPGPN